MAPLGHDKLERIQRAWYRAVTGVVLDWSFLIVERIF